MEAIEGRVDEVILENFKSYGGRVRVGPLQKFTCVVGPNGAGKSNLVDAIAFVLCASRRGDGVRDVVHRKESLALVDQATTAAVELVFVPAVDVGSVETPMVFRRSVGIAADGASQFQVDGVILPREDYLARLEVINILSKARNFLVFQGDVDQAAKRQGRALCQFFEQLSGSNTLREEYDRLNGERLRKEEAARHLFHRKRSAQHERKLMAHQKDEADQYMEHDAKYRKLQVEFYLFRLQGVQRRIEDAEQRRVAAEAERAPKAHQLDESRLQLHAAERERAEMHAAALQASRDATALRARLENGSPDLITVQGQILVLRRKLEELRQQAGHDQLRQQQVQDQITLLRQERNRLKTELVEQDEKAQKDLTFTPDQRRQFDLAQQEATRATAATSAQARDLEAQLRRLAADRARAEREASEAVTRIEFLRKKAEEHRVAEAAAREAAAKYSAGASERGQQVTRRREMARRHEEETQALRAERQELSQGIREIIATERQLQRDRQLAQVSADLMRLVPGVRGRVVDLCKPTDRRFGAAVQVVLAGYLDAVVTDTADAARECVRYLKDHMLEPMLFLPMDGLQVAQVDGRLTELVSANADPGDVMRVALHCVEFDARYDRVFRFMLGDVVFADNLETATRHAFGDFKARGINARFVTLQGETISRDGNLSVSSEAARGGGARFDFSAIEARRDRLDVIDKRLHQLHAHNFGGADAEALFEDARRLEVKVSEAELTARRHRESLEARQVEVESAEAELATARPEADRLAEDEARVGQELRSLEDSIGQAVSGYFRALSEAMCVADVRRQERESRQQREVAQRKRRELGQQLGNVEAESQMFEQTQQERAGRQSAAAAATQCDAELERLIQMKKQLSRGVDEVKSNRDAVLAQEAVCLEAESLADRRVAAQRADVREAQRCLGDVGKRLLEFNSDMQALEEVKTDLLQQSLLEDVEVPLVAGGVAGALQLPGAGRAVNFAVLPDDMHAAASSPEAYRHEEEYRARLRAARAELERARPNLKAGDQLVSAAEQAQGASREAAEAHREIEDVRRRFEIVRRDRRDLFMACYNQVASGIGAVYQQLTGWSGDGQDGGVAYLDLDDMEDPFTGGVQFRAMPPTKRFCDISLLSGGERSLAALALLFAVHAYQKPPFIVLDEVDAHLDPEATQALAAFVAAGGFQALVISLRDSVYSSGDALVGVSKDPQTESSVVWTVDLGQFRGDRAPLPPPLLAPG